MTNAESIIQVQTDYFNAPIIEIQVNAGFTDQDYQAEITKVGWYTGGEWCAFSAMLAWKQGYINNTHAEIWGYFWQMQNGEGGNSQQLANNAHNDHFWPTGLTPQPGAIIVWQAGDSHTEGHTGLCIEVDGDNYTTLEGNSIPPGNPGDEAHGYTIAKHVHTMGQPHSSLGLNFYRAVYAVEHLPQ